MLERNIERLVEEVMHYDMPKEELFTQNNKCFLIGSLKGAFEFSHSAYKEKFYKNIIYIQRKEEKFDEIPIIVSEKCEVFDFKKDYAKVKIAATGVYQSFTQFGKNGETHLELRMSVKHIDILGNSNISDANHIYLEGRINKVPIYKKTKLGNNFVKIEVTVNRPYGRNNNIPCILLPKNQMSLPKYSKGDFVEIIGRIQSKLPNQIINGVNEVEARMIYQVSISKMKKIA